ncbi:uncharacterized protein MONBRDRAFT_31254 [Monosiga brevicollis MX1]|uniref:BZIP domain-containing protein n=1 Tax=Monosiga brevicollis TaxID=81824 RepID=A9USN9_MONBE|nr:uncharacterized protein MONBRDRAFT_31254 [Monosiga brevicollis MX1]EDQ92134.1 predicted protein [Monosiga brevicollis MX1]|eukprot:XP_001743420.1 hypothetical protein [Monosiga brevicollis MX1]
MTQPDPAYSVSTTAADFDAAIAASNLSSIAPTDAGLAQAYSTSSATGVNQNSSLFLDSPDTDALFNADNLLQAATFPSTGYSLPGMSLPVPDADSFAEPFFAKFLTESDINAAFPAINPTNRPASSAAIGASTDLPLLPNASTASFPISTSRAVLPELHQSSALSAASGAPPLLGGAADLASPTLFAHLSDDGVGLRADALSQLLDSAPARPITRPPSHGHTTVSVPSGPVIAPTRPTAPAQLSPPGQASHTPDTGRARTAPPAGRSTAARPATSNVVSVAATPHSSDTHEDDDDHAGSTSNPNKSAADRYRKKKREEFERLQHDTEAMKAENLELKTRLSKLRNEAEFLANMLQSAIQYSPNRLQGLLHMPARYVTQAMLPEGLELSTFLSKREVIAALLTQIEAPDVLTSD